MIPLAGSREPAPFVRSCLVEYRKALKTEASARCCAAKIPFPLASYIARTFYPQAHP